MKLDRIDDIIVTRQLTLSDSEAHVIIKVGRPVKFPDGQDYFCPYQCLVLKMIVFDTPVALTSFKRFCSH